ncbi:MAG: hypothetical protein ACYC0N_00360 [Carboxydocellales bacterium]
MLGPESYRTSVGAVVKTRDELNQRITELEHALKELGHKMDTFDDVTNTKKDKRYSVTLLVDEWDKNVTMLAEFENLPLIFKEEPRAILEVS